MVLKSITSDDLKILDEKNAKAKMKDKDGNEVEINGSIESIFDELDDTFLDIPNEMALELTLEEQIKLMTLILKIRQGLNKQENGLGRKTTHTKAQILNDLSIRIYIESILK